MASDPIHTTMTPFEVSVLRLPISGHYSVCKVIGNDADMIGPDIYNTIQEAMDAVRVLLEGGENGK